MTRGIYGLAMAFREALPGGKVGQSDAEEIAERDRLDRENQAAEPQAGPKLLNDQLEMLDLPRARAPLSLIGESAEAGPSDIIGPTNPALCHKQFSGFSLALTARVFRRC